VGAVGAVGAGHHHASTRFRPCDTGSAGAYGGGAPGHGQETATGDDPGEATGNGRGDMASEHEPGHACGRDCTRRGRTASLVNKTALAGNEFGPAPGNEDVDIRKREKGPQARRG